MRIPHQESLAEFEKRKDLIKFSSMQDVYDWLHIEFNKKWLFYKYYKYFEYLKKTKHLKATKT